MIRKELGKIEKVYAGYCGYQQAQFGFQFTLGGDGWGVSTDAWAAWGSEPDEHCKWNRSDQIRHWGESMEKLRDIMKAAKVKNIYELEGVPVEVIFDGMQLESWRVLKEVL